MILMCVRNEIDGWALYDPDDSELEHLEYAFWACDEWETGLHFPYRFFNRWCKDEIKPPFSRDEFENSDEIIATLKGFNLDIEKFWWVLLFIYDWTETTFKDCLDVTSHSYGIMLRELLDILGENWSDVTINIRKGRKNIKVYNSIKRTMLEALQDRYKELQARGAENTFCYRGNESFNIEYKTTAYKIYFAAERLKELFRELERRKQLATPTRRKGEIVSYNKMLLFSRIIYLYKYSYNESYWASDEALKSIMKEYKGRVPLTISSVYH